MAKYQNVDWKRYHELIDIKAKREFSDYERKEYEKYMPIIEKLDAEEARRCGPVIWRLIKKHKEEMDKIDNLTERLKRE